MGRVGSISAIPSSGSGGARLCEKPGRLLDVAEEPDSGGPVAGPRVFKTRRLDRGKREYGQWTCAAGNQTIVRKANKP